MRKHWFKSGGASQAGVTSPSGDDKVIIWERPDGLMGHTVVVGGLCPHLEAECIVQMAARDPNDLHYGWRKIAVIDRSEMPDGGVPHHPHAKWKAAWKFDGDKVAVDMPTAREVHRNRLRQARAPRFVEADNAVKIADDSRNSKARAAAGAYRQALRDVTADPAIEAAATVEELDRVWPACLGSAA
jgi:hypothetical protein